MELNHWEKIGVLKRFPDRKWSGGKEVGEGGWVSANMTRSWGGKMANEFEL